MTSLANPSVEQLQAQDKDNHISDEAQAKEERLKNLLRDTRRILIAFSGGVDSTYLAYVANSVLGSDAVCVTGESASLSEYQRTETRSIAERFGFNHKIIETLEVSDSNYTQNNSNRCYFCKSELYSKLEPIAVELGIETIADGSTTDDLGDYRPGRKAAGEHRVQSPLIDVNLSKVEIRQLSRRANLPTWDRPASPCLSSRIAYGTPVTIERLGTVDRGESIMRRLGFREFRVRHHDELVRIEVSPAELPMALEQEMAHTLAREFRELGFRYVTLDLHGFRSGSMNEILIKKTKSGGQ